MHFAGNTEAGLTGMELVFIDKTNVKPVVNLTLADDKNANSVNRIQVYSETQEEIGNEIFGSKQNINGLTNFNINITLIGLTQFRVDFGSPVSSSLTTSYVESALMSDLGYVRFTTNGWWMKIIDRNCP